MNDLLNEVRQAIANETEQGTESWMRMRLGKFTGSNIYKLMAQGKRPMTQAELDAREKGPRGGLLDKRTTIEDDNILSDGAMTYVEERVAEVMTGQSTNSVDNDATRWGNELEPDARELFSTLYSKNILLTGHKCWEENPSEAGCSLDGEVEGEDATIEIKCPFNSAIHIGYCQLTDPKKLPPAYWYQIQAGLLFTGKSKCYFISYDPRVINEANRLFVLEVPAYKDAQELIKLKLRVAIAKKTEILNQLNK